MNTCTFCLSHRKEGLKSPWGTPDILNRRKKVFRVRESPSGFLLRGFMGQKDIVVVMGKHTTVW